MEELKNKKHINFLKNGGSLLVAKDGKIIFRSKDRYLMPLIECIAKHKNNMAGAYAFDKILGKAAALLFSYVKVKAVYSLKASNAGVSTLKENNIKCISEKIIPYILNSQRNDICPMEKLAYDKSPKSFYQKFF